jgi:hypothetical protein
MPVPERVGSLLTEIRSSQRVRQASPALPQAKSSPTVMPRIHIAAMATMRPHIRDTGLSMDSRP